MGFSINTVQSLGDLKWFGNKCSDSIAKKKTTTILLFSLYNEVFERDTQVK